ncbi:MAG TPA: M1 family metallopeptidase [Dokdonella sp.]|uniref:M1 family metallopeptidase n=1 Tax=Dokdonella sp. TaxID=2291710 RepID=UPI002D805C8A|nr:M1 family metallopeptidase [Dokdonella sp.]HET9032912.1 M1 family metallopeptidase [Dokdonella sp.]
MNASFISLVSVMCVTCGSAMAEADPHSYSEPNKVEVTAVALDLSVDFDEKELVGSAELALKWHDKGAKELVLDSRDLLIESIQAVDADGSTQDLDHRFDERDPIFGSALHIEMQKLVPNVRIRYRTSPQASGLQWMTPQQTASGKHPFMFSQSQAIHARSWVPLQDTPSVRFTYTAHIRAPKSLRVVMSADNDLDHPLDGDYRFSMKQPIPSYLLALSVGELAVRSTGPRTAVYAEPSMVAKAAKEFEDTEAMIEAAEKLYGPYRWERYDILVLPASFPFGGMENPRITFATPTVIAGDKSLVGLVAHELAHSWSGNLVTNANAQHMWLNEGFTTYVENRIVEAVYGKDVATMQLVVDDQELLKEMQDMTPGEQLLVTNLEGIDPDEGLSGVPYDKGRWFLRFLESRYGRDVFDPFLRSYFDHFAFQSITTPDFLNYYSEHLEKEHLGKVSAAEIDAWLHQPGIPASAPIPHSARFDVVDKAAAEFFAGTLAAKDIPAKNWVTYEWLRFLNALPDKPTIEQMKALDKAWKLTGTGNAEIAFRWYVATVRAGYTQARPQIAAFIERIGRRKLVVPIYEELAKTENGKAFAIEVYAKARPGYHPMTQASVDKVLGL